MARGVVLITALPPTIGHINLIEWARVFLSTKAPYNEHLDVIVCTQPTEPLVYERYWAISASFSKYNIGFYHLNDPMPQYPTEDNPDFWETWKSTILKHIRKVRPDDYIISSEPYGEKLAEVFGCKSVMFDKNREFCSISASDIRASPSHNSNRIAPKFIPYIQKQVTLFGAESVGKTTLMRDFKDWEYGHVTTTQEWARTYLESLENKTVTSEKMMEIVRGQYALESLARTQGNPLIVRDTDLLSTIGYYRLYNPSGYQEDLGYRLALRLYLMARSRADLYVLLSTELCKFTPDPLRYSGDKRESDDRYWLKLLEEFDCNYLYVDTKAKRYQVPTEIYNMYSNQPIFQFQRDKGE